LLILSLGKTLNRIASTFERLDWQVDSKTEKAPSLSLGRGTLTKNEYLNPWYGEMLFEPDY